jgi:hypothetical protein
MIDAYGTPAAKAAYKYVLSPALSGAYNKLSEFGGNMHDYLMSEEMDRPRHGRSVAPYDYAGRAPPTPAPAPTEFEEDLGPGPDEDEFSFDPSQDPEGWYCTAPYDVEAASTADILGSCTQGGPPHPAYANSVYPSKGTCIQGCYF